VPDLTLVAPDLIIDPLPVLARVSFGLTLRSISSVIAFDVSCGDNRVTLLIAGLFPIPLFFTDNDMHIVLRFPACLSITFPVSERPRKAGL